MYQPTFASVELEQKKRKTRRDLFLERLDALMPWEELEARIEPRYPKAGRGRWPYPLAGGVFVAGRRRSVWSARTRAMKQLTGGTLPDRAGHCSTTLLMTSLLRGMTLLATLPVEK